MKIEFECQRCRSTLRVDDSHRGKPVRCPVCGNVEIAPLAGAADSSPPPVVSLKPEPFLIRDDEPAIDAGKWRTLSPAEERQEPVAPDPWRPPVQPIRPAPVSGSGKNDGYWVFAMVVGILALVLHVSVCGCGSVPAFPLSLMGLIAAWNSTSPNRRAPIIVNLVAMGISLLWLVLAVLGGLLGAVFG
jgi:ribosomal protein S27E